MKLTIRHQLRIVLPEGASRAVLHLLLTPRSGPTQTVGDWKVQLPDSADAVSFADAFGNRAMLVAQAKPPAEWSLVAAGTVETQDRNGVLGRVPGEPVPRLFLRQTGLTQPHPELLAAFAAQAGSKDRIGLLHGLMAKTPVVLRKAALKQSQSAPDRKGQLQSQSQAQAETTPPAPPTAAQTRAMAVRVGAKDLAHAFIGAARALGIPARYVTGYLAKDSAVVPAMHAWAEAYDDGLGWIGFDAVLQLCPTDRHVRVACGLDAASAAPLRSVPVVGTSPAAKLSIEIAASASPGTAAIRG